MINTITSKLQMSSLNEPLIPEFSVVHQSTSSNQNTATMTTVFNEAKENRPGVAEVVSGMSTPEKLIGRSCQLSDITAPTKKRCRINSSPLSSIPVQWRPEPSKIWTKVTKDCSAKCPPAQLEYKIGSKRRHPHQNTCQCKRPILDFSKMCKTSYVKFGEKDDSHPKTVELDIVALCDEPEVISLRPIQISPICTVDRTSLSPVNIDLDSMERD